ncbi:MAG: hypothetical protein GEU79_02040 [Acidimicrobiia bacterium]|nr:hypothetical protein [Acidimicrobiia bacterium]
MTAMSDLAAAAAAVGAPEELVQRSAEARAQANGTSIEEVLAAWAGGGSPAAAAPAEAESDTQEATETDAAPPEPAEEQAPAEEPPVEDPGSAIVPTEPAPAPVAAAGPGSDVIPILVTEKNDQPLVVIFGAVAMFVVLALLGWVFPSLPSDSDQVVTSRIDFSAEAIEGRTLYQQLDCASCHTQMVRPVVADVALGPVTLDDTNQVLGTRRIGPDLTYVGSRLGPAEIQGVITQGGSHPVVSLNDEDLAALTNYLVESQSDNVETASDE